MIAEKERMDTVKIVSAPITIMRRQGNEAMSVGSHVVAIDETLREVFIFMQKRQIKL